jgi:hypothetical protein
MSVFMTKLSDEHSIICLADELCGYAFRGHELESEQLLQYRNAMAQLACELLASNSIIDLLELLAVAIETIASSRIRASSSASSNGRNLTISFAAMCMCVMRVCISHQALDIISDEENDRISRVLASVVSLLKQSVVAGCDVGNCLNIVNEVALSTTALLAACQRNTTKLSLRNPMRVFPFLIE